MKPQRAGYCVAVAGASSLLGKELVTVLAERHFPLSRLVTFEMDEEEPDLPIIDLREGSHATVQVQDVTEAEVDFAFLAGRSPRLPSFLNSAGNPPSTGAGGQVPQCYVIDLACDPRGEELSLREDGSRGETLRTPVSIPFLDRQFPSSVGRPESRFCVAAHPPVIMISTLLLRLAARFPLKTAVAQVFSSASESGSRGIEELQKQTVNLLSFQKIPRQIFGAQLAFNLLPRLGRGGSGNLAGLEHSLRQQLRQYLGGRVPLPALRIFQVPVFYSLALSLYVETLEPLLAEQVGAALQGERIHLRRLSQDAPSQVETTGSGDILVDSVACDATHPTGIWIWAVADNVRLAALNAVEIAESVRDRVPTRERDET